MNKDDYIDICKEWLTNRKAAYLAKEDRVVYYTSHTGRKDDYLWMSLSLVETVRMIQVTHLSPDNRLEKSHVIAALQELARVYEFGLKSTHPMQPHIFNYLDEAGEDMGDVIMSMLAEECQLRNYNALLYLEVKKLFNLICTKLVTEVSNKEQINLIHKHWPNYGYEVRVDKYRPQINGRKQSAIMLPHCKPKDVVELDKESALQIARKIYGALR